MAIVDTTITPRKVARRRERLFDRLKFGSVMPRRTHMENAKIIHVDPMQQESLQVGRSSCMIDIIAVSYRRYGELRVFVQSLLNQTCQNWTLTVIHDGPDDEFCEIMEGFKRVAPGHISYDMTKIRYADYGHSLREAGLSRAHGDYVLLTNADNYFVPRAVEFLSDVVGDFDPDVVMFDMVHSHHRPGKRKLPSYSFFETDYKRNSIDVSAAIVRKDLAQAAGFRDKGYAGDATYFEDVALARAPDLLRIVKLPRVLFVHN